MISLVVFVGNLTDNLFEDVFHRDEARDAAVFIVDDGEVDLLALHQFEQRWDACRQRHIDRLAQDVAQDGERFSGAMRFEGLQ